MQPKILKTNLCLPLCVSLPEDSKALIMRPRLFVPETSVPQLSVMLTRGRGTRLWPVSP